MRLCRFYAIIQIGGDVMNSITQKRILAFLIDFITLCFIFEFIIMYIVRTTESSLFEISNSPILYAVMLILFVLWSFKDIFNGASIGKRILKIKIVDENYKTPRIYKLVLHNIVLCLWPIEVYFLLKQKTGFSDKITNTQIIEV